MALPRRSVTGSLLTRVVATNAIVYGAGALLLAFGPFTVPRSPDAPTVLVLAAGVLALTLLVALLLSRMLRALDDLVASLQVARADAPIGRVPVPRAEVARQLARAVDDLLDRVEAAQRDRSLAVVEAEEAERSRIAQELHDGVGQSLTAVLLELAATDRSASAREGVRGALEEVRAVARRLRPHVLEDLGLRSALTALTTDLFGAGDVVVERSVVPGLPPMSQAAELVVFRVAQEALTNVARHADARTVRVRLGVVGSAVELVVEDDGRGLPPDVGQRGGTGLRGMRERAAGVGGDLEVARREGGGTRVRLRLPTGATA